MNKNEFAERVETLKKRLYRTAYLYLNDEAGALDAVDEAVYKALKALTKLRQPEYFDTWLTRILINECKKECKRRKRVSPVESLPEEGSEEISYDALPLKEAIRKLPPDLRMIVILRFFSGFTLAQTAESMELPQGTVATKQRRALEFLKLDLSEEGLQ